MKKKYEEKKLKFFFGILYLYLISSIIFPSSENYGSTDSYGFKRLIPQLLSTLIVIITASSVFKALNKSNIIIRKFYYFALYTFINFILYSILKNASLYFIAEQFKIFVWIFPIYYLYNLFSSIDEELINTYLHTYIYIFLSYLMISIFQEYAFRSTGSIEIMTEGQGVYSGGAIYFIMPLIFIVFNRRWSTYLWLVGLAIAIMTAKRTPIVLLIVFGVFQLKGMLKSLKFKDYTILSIIVVVIGTYVLAQYWDMLIERNASDAERGGSYGSGREIFYYYVLDGWINSDLISQLFGHGFGSVQSLLLKKYGMAISSHNGFLDCVYVYGLLGLIIYVSIFISLFKRYSVVKKYLPQYGYVYLAFIFMWLVQNLIIHGFAGPNMIPYGIFIAYIESKIYKKKKYGYQCECYNRMHE